MSLAKNTRGRSRHLPTISYSMDIGRDDATKAKVNDNMAGEPVGLFETRADISGGSLSTLGNWTITDIVVSGDRVDSFTVNHGGNPANRRNGTTAASPVNGITDLSLNARTGSCCRK